MLDLIPFLIGVYLFFKGEFRVGARRIPRPQARLIGMLLTLPLLVAVCASTFLISTQIDPELLSEVAAAGDLGAFTNNPQFIALTQQLAFIELVTLVFVVGMIVMIVMGIPPSNATTTQNMPHTDAPVADGERPADGTPLERDPPSNAPAAPRPSPPRPAAPPLVRPAAANAAAPSAPPDIMTVEQAAAYANLTPAEILALIDGSKLGAVRSRGSYVIARAALDDYLGRA
jgi:excisionase family DNA binding protein